MGEDLADAFDEGLDEELEDPRDVDRCLPFEPERESDFDPDLGLDFALLPDLDLDLDLVVGMLKSMLQSYDRRSLRSSSQWTLVRYSRTVKRGAVQGRDFNR